MFNTIKESFKRFLNEVGYNSQGFSTVNRTESIKGSSSAVYDRYDAKYGLHVE